jgi:hypothetical protein
VPNLYIQGIFVVKMGGWMSLHKPPADVKIFSKISAFRIFAAIEADRQYEKK